MSKKGLQSIKTHSAVTSHSAAISQTLAYRAGTGCPFIHPTREEECVTFPFITPSRWVCERTHSHTQTVVFKVDTRTHNNTDIIMHACGRTCTHTRSRGQAGLLKGTEFVNVLYCWTGCRVLQELESLLYRSCESLPDLSFSLCFDRYFSLCHTEMNQSLFFSVTPYAVLHTTTCSF